MLVTLEILLAVLAGVATAFQPGVNSKFAAFAGDRIHGGVINFAVGFATMLLVVAVTRSPLPSPATLAQGPWWMWIGGVLGAFFVTTAVFLVPKLGAASYLAAMIAGQLLASVFIDHYGAMGLPEVKVTVGKVLGVVLIFAGMLCVKLL